MADKPATRPVDEEGTSKEPSFLRQLGQGFLAERAKGNLPTLNPRTWFMFRGSIRQQRELAMSDRQRQFLAETLEVIERVKNLRVKNPTRSDSFEAAVKRQGLTEDFLQKKMQRLKWMHLGLYVFSGALLVYAFWLALNHGLIVALGVLAASLCAAVHGYLHGFRAWQIEHRNLIRLQDALRIPGTYLVL